MQTTLRHLIDTLSGKLNTIGDFKAEKVLEVEILSAFSVIVKREYEKTRIFNEALVQTLFSVPLVEIESNEIESLDCDKLLRTKTKIPIPLVLKDGTTLFKSITTNILSSKVINIALIGLEAIGYLGCTRFSKKATVATWDNGFIYIHNNLDLKHITVKGLFSNPYEVRAFKEENDTSFLNAQDTNFTEEGELIIPQEFVYNIITLVFSLYNRPLTDKQEIKINE